MIQQLLRMAALAIHEHCEPAIAVFIWKADHSDRLQCHPQPGSWHLVGNQFEDILIEGGDVNALDAVLIGPRMQVKGGPFRRDSTSMGRQRLF